MRPLVWYNTTVMLLMGGVMSERPVQGKVRVEATSATRYSFAFDGGNAPDLIATVVGENEVVLSYIDEHGPETEIVDNPARVLGVVCKILEGKHRPVT